MAFIYLYGLAFLAKSWLVVTGGAPLVIDQIAQTYSSRWRTWVQTHGRWRRRAEIAFLIGAILWAGFAAWKDEYDQEQADAARINGKDGYVARLASASGALSADERAINSPGGYRDQIAALQAKPGAQSLSPPKIVVASPNVPAAPITRPIAQQSGDLQTETRDGKLFVTGATMSLANMGTSMVSIRINKLSLSFNGVIISAPPIYEQYYIANGRTLDMRLGSSFKATEVPTTGNVSLYLEATYDDVPPRAVRHTAIRYDYVVLNNGTALSSKNIGFQREW